VKVPLETPKITYAYEDPPQEVDWNDEGFMNEDTIPSELKQLFWTDKIPPYLLNYDAIGFDVDHCLVKYNNLELSMDVINAYLQALVNDK